MCITPSEAVEDTIYAVLESVLLNSHFGVNNFLLYDNVLSGKLLTQLNKAKASLKSDLNLRILPWNLPHALDARHRQWLVDTDCYYRTRHTVETVLVLTADQIVVPRRRAKIQQELDKHSKSGLFRVNVLKFCSELPAEASSAKNAYSFRALEQSQFDEGKTEKKTVIRKGRPDMDDYVELDTDVITVNDYGACGTFDFDDEATKTDTFLSDRSANLQQKFGAYFPMKAV